ncbi:hypothetical protein HH310_17420 [Actinoplanes sp. TBRC 11911]|nr:hypothetical protein [Actinoplanes sp. TBRC 11911]
MSAAGTLAIAAALAVGLAPGTAQAAPKPVAKPTAIYITGNDLPDKIVIQQQSQSRLFDSMLSEVSWMATPPKGQTTKPKPDKLGPKYVLTVLNKTAPLQVYELYPLAAGGPRAHRPAAQPSGKKADAWFYGRLTMPGALRVSGAPLQTKPDVVAGGIGGGGLGQNVDSDELDPVAGMNTFLDQMRRLLLLNGAVLVAILTGLAGIAFLIRRKI